MTDVPAPWRTIMWAGQQSQAAWWMPSQGELEGSKKTLLKRARRLSKEAAISECSSSGGTGALHFPWWSGANGGATMLPLRRRIRREAEEDYRDEPWTQWCFRAESQAGTSPARSIPIPTVTSGTHFSPFKHIICARMAVKHHTLRSSTHPVPWYCCVCRLFLSIIEPLKDLDGGAFLSIWYLDQRQDSLRTIDSLHI